jgi:hypothetical protein
MLSNWSFSMEPGAPRHRGLSQIGVLVAFPGRKCADDGKRKEKWRDARLASPRSRLTI